MRPFWELCTQAKEMGIRIILDGVFSHTGSDSIYFNRKVIIQGRCLSISQFPLLQLVSVSSLSR